jgi:hypothetical protein
MMRIPTILLVAALATQAATAQEEAPAPSAELIVDAEETIINEPALDPGQEPLPLMDIPFPEDDNIFGDALYAPEPVTGVARRTGPVTPPPMPLLEDPRETERQMRIRLRKIRARLVQDPRLVELEEMAGNAPTPEDYRAARRAWYALFFDRVRRADASLKDFADQLERQAVAGLYQTRVEPTWPLQPAPQPQPQARFVPERQFPDLPDDEQPVRFR